MDPYDWVCGPGSQLLKWRTVILNCNNIYCFYCIFFLVNAALGVRDIFQNVSQNFSKNTKIKYNAVKRSIAINRIQNKRFCSHKIGVCSVYIYVH